MAAELEAAKAAAGEQAGKLAEDLANKTQELAELQARFEASEQDVVQTRATLEEQEAAARSQAEAAAAASTRCGELEAALAAVQDQLQASQEVRDRVWPPYSVGLPTNHTPEPGIFVVRCATELSSYT